MQTKPMTLTKWCTKALSNVKIHCTQPGTCSPLVKVQSIVIMVCIRILTRAVKSFKDVQACNTPLRVAITWLALLLILTLFTEDTVLHSKSVLLPETAHSCPSFPPTLVPVQLHNCPLHFFFPGLLFSWFTSSFRLLSKYEPITNSILKRITTQIGREHILPFCHCLIWYWLTTSLFWTPQTFCNTGSINLLPTCHWSFTQISILLAACTCKKWPSFLGTTSEWAAGQWISRQYLVSSSLLQLS